jgi:hypothetical protein
LGPGYLLSVAGGTLRYHPTSANAAACRTFIWLGILQAQALAAHVLNCLVIDGWPAAPVRIVVRQRSIRMPWRFGLKPLRVILHAV